MNVHYERKFYSGTGCGISPKQMLLQKLVTTFTPSKVTCKKCRDYLRPYQKLREAGIAGSIGGTNLKNKMLKDRKNCEK